MYKRLLELLKLKQPRQPALQQCSVSGSFFKEIVIMKADGVVLKTLQIIDHIPKTNNLIMIDGKMYQVTSNVFNYDLKCINIWVGVA